MSRQAQGLTQRSGRRPAPHLREGPLSLVARGGRPGVCPEPRVKAKVLLISSGYRSLCSCLRKSSAFSDPTSSSKAIFSSCVRHKASEVWAAPGLATTRGGRAYRKPCAFLTGRTVNALRPDGPGGRGKAQRGCEGPPRLCVALCTPGAGGCVAPGERCQHRARGPSPPASVAVRRRGVASNRASSSSVSVWVVLSLCSTLQTQTQRLGPRRANRSAPKAGRSPTAPCPPAGPPGTCRSADAARPAGSVPRASRR